MARPWGQSSVPAWRRSAVAAAAAAISLLVYACGGEERFAQRICPQVQILEYADRLTEFAGGAGRDVTDVVLRGRLVNFEGECNVEEDAVQLDLALDFLIERGPASRRDKGRFAYFVAISEFHPAPGGKRVFPIELDFESGVNRLAYRDQISVEIPVAEGRSASDFNLFIGFQLDRGQLEFNRSGGRAGG